ncbi:MAG: PstS family phosphate ABC transporter substrate-binding protein [Chloroflexota bacterium]|nr:PstS family phosphate ABC transporter substrate-binding protein [Chloroflexota bacterium]
MQKPHPVFLLLLFALVLTSAFASVFASVFATDHGLPEVDPLEFTEGEIITAGSSTVFPLSERMAELWTDAGGVAPSIASIGSGAGFERFCVEGETDISNASRAIKDSERESCKSIGRDPIEFRVGADALAVTVSAANDFVSDVTMEELVMIFSSADAWSDVRAEWPHEAIQRFIPGTDSGTFDYFVEAVFEEDEEPILSANPQLSEDDNVLVQGITGSPYAVGFFGYAYYVENQNALNILNIDGIEANAQTTDDGSYPLARPLFIYSDAGIMMEKPQVNAFINFYLTHVNDAVVDVGYFPASEYAFSGAIDYWRIANGMLPIGDAALDLRDPTPEA